MKKLLILLFSILISFNSYGKWVFYSESVKGNSFYFDSDSVKQHNGYVYFWYLKDYLKPDMDGDMSVKVYLQGDCDVNQYLYLTYIYYNEPMGNGNSTTLVGDTEWTYPPPDTIGASLLNDACAYVD